MFRWILFLIVFFIAGCGSPKDQDLVGNEDLKAKAQVDRTSITIGDKIKYTITAYTNKNVEVEFLPFNDKDLSGFAIKDFGSYSKVFLNKKTPVQWYILDNYVTGTYTLPKAVVKYKLPGENNWQRLETKEIKIEVKSLLTDSPEKSLDIKDIHGPLNLPDKFMLIIIITSGVLLLLAVSAGLGFIIYKHKQAKKVPQLPAHIIAYKALENLKNKDYLLKGMIQEYYIELSNIVRHYLENRFSLRAPEMTTEEFLITIKDAKILSYEQKDSLRDFLSNCDMVKFAKYSPEETEINNSMQLAKHLIDQTKQEEVTLEVK